MKSIVHKPLLVVLALLLTTQAIHSQNKPPTVTLTPTTTNEFVHIGITGFHLTLEATDEDGQVQQVQLIHNAQSVTTWTTGNWPLSSFYVDVHPGLNEFYAIAYDNQNASATSAPVRITGNLPPTIGFTDPVTPPAVYSLSESVIVRATASDPDGSIREVRLLENGQVIATDLQAPYEFAYKPLTYGSYNLRLQAEDDHGGVSTTSSRSVQYVRIFDNLEPAIPLNSGVAHTLRASNVGATHQKGEPEHAGVPGGKSVWFVWRAPTIPGSGMVTMETLGSDFDTVLAVYTNRTTQSLSMSNLVEVASNDNSDSIEPLSRVKFLPRSGTTYYIAVDGRDGMAGNIQLKIGLAVSVSPRQPHNFIANAAVFVPEANSNNIGANKEPNEPDHAGNPGGASVWYRIDVTSTSTPWIITTAGSRFDTLLAVYTNANYQPQLPQLPPSMENLRLVAFNDDGPVTNTSEIVFSPKTIGTYWIAVDGYNGAEGIIRFSATPFSQTTPPLNDFFGKATTLLGASALTTHVNTFRATREPGEPAPLFDGTSSSLSQRTVWYRWIAPSTGPVYMTTESSDFDTILAVYTGTNISSLSLVASNDDDPTGGQTSALLFNAIAGIEYRIGIAGYRGAYGNLVFALNQNAFYLPRLITQFQSGRLLLSIPDAPLPLLLEGSPDLVHWGAVRMLSANDELEITVSQEVPRLFYRVKMPD